MSETKPTHIWRWKGDHYAHRANDQWVKEPVYGETSRSWLIGDPDRSWSQWKVPKKGHNARSFAFSESDIEDRRYVGRNAYRISQAVQRCEDAHLLRHIASMVGYEPEDES